MDLLQKFSICSPYTTFLCIRIWARRNIAHTALSLSDVTDTVCICPRMHGYSDTSLIVASHSLCSSTCHPLLSPSAFRALSSSFAFSFASCSAFLARSSALFFVLPLSIFHFLSASSFFLRLSFFFLFSRSNSRAVQ